MRVDDARQLLETLMRERGLSPSHYKFHDGPARLSVVVPERAGYCVRELRLEGRLRRDQIVDWISNNVPMRKGGGA